MNVAYPDCFSESRVNLPNSVLVAANLLALSELNQYLVCVTNEINSSYTFPLDLQSSNYQSKGNWIWVTKVEVLCANNSLFICDIEKRVIDMPYPRQFC